MLTKDPMWKAGLQGCDTTDAPGLLEWGLMEGSAVTGGLPFMGTMEPGLHLSSLFSSSHEVNSPVPAHTFHQNGLPHHNKRAKQSWTKAY